MRFKQLFEQDTNWGRLLRGFKDPVKIGTVISPRKDRMPRDTDAWMHTYVNKLLRAAGKPGRDEVLFATTILGDALYYGDAYVIEPLEGTKLWANRSVQDFTGTMEHRFDSGRGNGLQLGAEALVRPFIEEYELNAADTVAVQKQVVDYWFQLFADKIDSGKVYTSWVPLHKLPKLMNAARKEFDDDIFDRLNGNFTRYVEGMKEVTPEMSLPAVEILIDGPVRVIGEAE